MAFVYEPEAAIGVAEPIPAEQAGAGCGFIRGWLAERFGQEVAQAVRIIYGGSVTPDHAIALLTQPDVDGLGAGRKGRDPEAFARIVRLVAERRV
jgi:triosephosphate isomerase